MLFISNLQNSRKIKKKPHIVTYDWLEDSLRAEKPIRDTDKYDPGKPRDIYGMIAAFRKVKPKKDGTAKPSSSKKSFEKQTEADDGDDDDDEHESPLASGSLGTDVADDEGVVKAGATSSSTGQTVASSSTKKTSGSFTARVTSQPPAPKPEPKPIIEVYRDETDGFPYRIELARVGRSTGAHDCDKRVVEVVAWANRVPKTYCCRAFLYENGKKAHERKVCQWVPSVKEALDAFASDFRRKMGYPWDERLRRAGSKGGNGGRWLYEVPAPRQPTGATPPEHTPGRPRYIPHRASLLPNAMRRPGNLFGSSRPFDCQTNKKTADKQQKTYKKAVRPGPPTKQKKEYKTPAFVPQSPKKRKPEPHPSCGDRAKFQKTMDAKHKACPLATAR